MQHRWITTAMQVRAGRYIEFVRYNDIFFIRDTVWSNTVNIEFDTSASGKKIYREEDTDFTAAEKVHNTLCSKHMTSFIWRALKNS